MRGETRRWRKEKEKEERDEEEGKGKKGVKKRDSWKSEEIGSSR